jgi:tetratricopeptide (TPR) repeat protein
MVPLPPDPSDPGQTAKVAEAWHALISAGKDKLDLLEGYLGFLEPMVLAQDPCQTAWRHLELAHVAAFGQLIDLFRATLDCARTLGAGLGIPGTTTLATTNTGEMALVNPMPSPARPTAMKAWLLASRAAVALRDRRTAQECLAKAQALGTEQTLVGQASLATALVYELSGKHTLAKGAFASAKHSGCPEPAATLYLARSLLRGGKTAEGHELLADLDRSLPPEDWETRAYVEILAGKADAAATIYAAAAEGGGGIDARFRARRRLAELTAPWHPWDKAPTGNDCIACGAKTSLRAEAQPPRVCHSESLDHPASSKVWYRTVLRTSCIRCGCRTTDEHLSIAFETEF